MFLTIVRLNTARTGRFCRMLPWTAYPAGHAAARVSVVCQGLAASNVAEQRQPIVASA